MSATATRTADAPVVGWPQLRRAQARRRRFVSTGSVVLVVVLAIVGLMVGAAGLGVLDVVAALVGEGDASDLLVVRRLRLPRVLGAIASGVSFGIAGSLFQSTLRNPLASPDILGISSGASVGAVWALLGLGLTGLPVSAMAGVGALGVAIAIWLLAWRQGLHGIRFVLVGIGFAYLGSSLAWWLLTRAEVREAAQALLWTVGSLSDVRDTRLVLLLVCAGVLGPLAMAQRRRLRILALGDEHARALGVGATRARATMLLVGVALMAVATSVVGPVPFVALVSPAIARGLLDDGDPGLVASGAIGGALMLASDLVGQHALPGQVAAPVGVVTGLVGAPYLVWLLTRAETGSTR